MLLFSLLLVLSIMLSPIFT